MCVRGLKLQLENNITDPIEVARHVRAWIETIVYVISHHTYMSHAMCVRGLKHCTERNLQDISRVARHVRAWIET